MSDTVIWRDAIDKNQFWLGIKASHGYCGWMPIFCDAISDCFGTEAWEVCRDIKPGVPVPVRVTMNFSVKAKS